MFDTMEPPADQAIPVAIDEAMAAVETAIALVASVELDDRPTKALGADLIALTRLTDRLTAQWHRVAGEWDARQGWLLDGHRAGAPWLARRTKLPRSEAHRRLRLAHRLRRHEPTRSAYEAGALGTDQAKLLADAAASGDAAAYDEIEPALVEAATRLGHADTGRVVGEWVAHRDALADDGTDAPPDPNREQRALYLSRTVFGAWGLDGQLCDEGGHVVDAALRRLVDLDRDGDDDPAPTRTPAQRRADALVELARHFLASSIARDPDDETALRASGADRNQVVVTIDYETLLGDLAHLGARWQDGHTLPAATARRMACDCAVLPMVLDGRSVPLDLGRERRTANRSLRRALRHRDGGCSFPGCERPVQHCDVHHIVPWSEHGPTDLANTCLLCWWHHHLVHEGGWRMRLDHTTGRPTFTDPQGTEHHAEPPPWAQPGLLPPRRAGPSRASRPSRRDRPAPRRARAPDVRRQVLERLRDPAPAASAR